MRPTKLGDTKILHDERIRANLLQCRKSTNHVIDLRLFNNCIERDIDLFAVCTSIGNKMPQVVKRKIGGKGTGREVNKPTVDGIRTSPKGRQCRLEVPCERKKFNSLHTVLLYHFLIRLCTACNTATSE